jgi:hypothetical protein
MKFNYTEKITVLLMADIKIMVLCDVTLCSFIETYQLL